METINKVLVKKKLSLKHDRALKRVSTEYITKKISDFLYNYKDDGNGWLFKIDFENKIMTIEELEKALYDVRIHLPKICRCKRIPNYFPKLNSYVIMTYLESSHSINNVQCIYFKHVCAGPIGEDCKSNPNLVNFIKNCKSSMCNDSLMLEPNAFMCIVGDKQTLDVLCEIRRKFYNKLHSTNAFASLLVHNNDVSTNVLSASLKELTTFDKILTEVTKTNYVFDHTMEILNKNLKNNKQFITWFQNKIEEDMHTLIIIEKESKSKKGTYMGFPGGKREYGETSVDTAFRETKEEMLFDFNKSQFCDKIKIHSFDIFCGYGRLLHIFELPKMDKLMIYPIIDHENALNSNIVVKINDSTEMKLVNFCDTGVKLDIVNDIIIQSVMEKINYLY